MRPPTTPLAGAAAATVLLLAGLPSTITAAAPPPAEVMRCKEIVVDGHKYNFGELGGPHTVVTNEYDPPAYYNYTYTLDICAPLKRKGDVKKEEQCGGDARVCRLKHHYSPSDKKSTFETATTLAGGSSFHYEATKLDSSSDHNKDGGIKLTFTGYKHQSRHQKVVINFVCNKTLTGTEGEIIDSEDQYEKPKLFTRDGDDKKEEEGDDGYPETQKTINNGTTPTALVWNGYKRVGEDVDQLELTWYTKFACLDASGGGDKPKDGDKPSDGDKDKPKDGDKDKPKDGDDKDGGNKGGNGEEDINKSWGFFTWLVVLLFLAIAAYLIFGSWLNYNRYGARGWDLLPHGDTIRDIPYLLKDWTRRVLNTVQSSGSRGGYSAV